MLLEEHCEKMRHFVAEAERADNAHKLDRLFAQVPAIMSNFPAKLPRLCSHLYASKEFNKEI